MTAVEFVLVRRCRNLQAASKTRRLTTSELDLLEFLEPFIVQIEKREAVIHLNQSVREYLKGATR